MEDEKLLKVLCVFCGSSPGVRPEYVEQAKVLGKLLAENGVKLSFGGGSLGVMGAVSQAVMEYNGQVVGVIPESLYSHVQSVGGHNDHCSEVVRVHTMHDRKQRLYQMSSAFVALPGGVGTFEELFEAVTWQQLGIHGKPVAVLNINGYYDPLIQMLSRAHAEGFIRDSDKSRLLVFERAEDIIPGIEKALREGPPKSAVVWDEKLRII